ncbi:hypothetical protein ABK040_006930 [Willaertia magna]
MEEEPGEAHKQLLILFNIETGRDEYEGEETEEEILDEPPKQKKKEEKVETKRCVKNDKTSPTKKRKQLEGNNNNPVDVNKIENGQPSSSTSTDTKKVKPKSKVKNEKTSPTKKRKSESDLEEKRKVLEEIKTNKPLPIVKAIEAFERGDIVFFLKNCEFISQKSSSKISCNKAVYGLMKDYPLLCTVIDYTRLKGYTADVRKLSHIQQYKLSSKENPIAEMAKFFKEFKPKI